MPETPLRVAQTIGITAAGLSSGLCLGMSIFIIPRLLELPTPLMLQQWKRTYHSGKAIQPLIAVLASIAYFTLSYDAYHRKLPIPQWRPYLASGLLAIGIVPYTLAFIMPTNKKLLQKAGEMQVLGIEAEEDLPRAETAHALVDKWATLNVGRAVMLALSAMIGTWTSLSV